MIIRNIIYLNNCISPCLPLKVVKQQLINLKAYDMFTDDREIVRFEENNLYFSIGTMSFAYTNFTKNEKNFRDRCFVSILNRVYIKYELIKSICDYDINLMRCK